ncbi:serine/threonine-protein kinase LMTK2-like isoform X1 [Mytilus californianus]|uniref:serine/threonine-protein kinase LMTK2-like isoform X1 n=1 Tax=Mytilus californianus TaxID=6549 RepID=UPI002245767A|nr:serine/threonine-protein kinase LMTK2-like isoform X1 [Mytilus californianus]
MIDIAVLAGVAIVISSVVLVFGCVCHLFKRGSGFTTFENDLEGGFGNTVFSQGDTSDISQVTFETIPDILAKTVTATALRPRISCTNTEIQKQSAKRVASFKAFPRSHLTYIKEMGVGWFGQVLVSEAYNMVTSSRSTRVVVKMMKDDANSTEQQLFLQDLSVYRELDHPNVLKLLGQCTEASPFLTIVEYASMGDLKSYLRKERQIVKTMKDGIVRMQFLTDMASGLQCLHVNGYLHHDFACRNCMVMSNMTVKIGDYGVAEDHFREDYYDNGQDLLPIRWMAPESISLTNSIWQVTEFTKQSNMWSFGVAMFEVTEYGQQPYKDLTDEMVLQNMIKAYPTSIELPHTDDPIKSQLYQMMQLCWQDSSHRPQIEEIHAQLQKIQSEKEAADEAEFERKWAKMSTREARVVKVEVHASDISGLKHNVVDDICAADFNSNSLPTHINVDEKGDTIFNCEIVSGSIGHDSPISTPNRPTVHRSTSTPVGSNKDSNKVNNSQPSTPVSLGKDVNKVSNSQPNTPQVFAKDVKKVSNLNSQMNTSEVSSNELNKVRTSQSITDEDKSTISVKTLSNKDQTGIRPQQVTSKDQALSSINEDRVKLDSSIPDICINGTKIENNPSSESSVCKTQLYLTVDKEGKDSQSIVSGGMGRNEEKIHKNENSVSFVNNSVDSIIDFEEKYGETHNSVHKQKMLSGLPKSDNVEDIHSETNSKTDNIDDLSDENEEDEAEKLKLLKLTLSGVLLSTDMKSSTDENSGISSPTSDDMDIAREIYMSKGMSVPPSKYTSTRSLNTILEDELLCENENEPQTIASSNELKFVEPSEDFNISDSYIDSFEWDDYIGDELVGRVRNSDISPRESIDFPDWTMEQDSSSQDSEIQNDSKTEANPSGKSGKKMNTSNLSDSEVKNSPLGALASTRSPKSPLGAAAHSYVKHILSNRSSNTNKNVSFYSFSHNTDQEQEHGTSTASLYNPMDEWEI